MKNNTDKTMVAINIAFSAPLLVWKDAPPPPKTEERPPPRLCKDTAIIKNTAVTICNISKSFIFLPLV